MRRIVLPVMAGLLAACGGGGGDAPPGEGAASEMAPMAGVEYLTAARITGIVMVGQGLTEFLPCGEGPELWLNGPLAIDIAELHGEMTPGVEFFEGMFIDVVGDIGPPPSVGAGSAYPASLIAKHLRRAAYEGWNCGDIRPEVQLEAWGTEPFWNLQLTDEGARYTTPDGGTRRVQLGEVRMVPEGWTVSGTADELAVEVFLEDFGCRDAMSGAYAHLSATVTIGGTEMQGCAWFGEALDPDARS